MKNRIPSHLFLMTYEMVCGRLSSVNLNVCVTESTCKGTTNLKQSLSATNRLSNSQTVPCLYLAHSHLVSEVQCCQLSASWCNLDTSKNYILRCGGHHRISWSFFRRFQSLLSPQIDLTKRSWRRVKIHVSWVGSLQSIRNWLRNNEDDSDPEILVICFLLCRRILGAMTWTPLLICE